MHTGELIEYASNNARRLLLTEFSQTIARHLRLTRPLIRMFTPPIAPALDRIDAAEAQLRKTTPSMESRFLESGAALEDLSASSQSLVDNSAELVRLATGRVEAQRIMSDTMAVLAEPLAFLDRYTEQLGGHTVSLEEGCALLVRLLNFETDLQAAVAPLRATRTMFRVEAARLPEAEQAAFVALSDQIETLQNQVRDSFGAEFAKLSETRTAMNKLVKQLGHESGVQKAVLERERVQIAEQIGKLNQQIDLNSSRDVQLTMLGRVVEGAVSRVVMTLQNQDIVAQRTQHLFEGLEKIRTVGRGLEHGQSDKLHEELGHLRALLEIQGGQASSALEHLDETSTASSQATTEILTTVDALDQECVFLQEFSEVTAAANGTIQVLLDIVDKTREMVDSSVRLATDSLEQIQPVNALTTQLSDCVEGLSHQMNLVALNAQIQALQIGAGTGLEVLAAHTAMVATETSRLGVAISEDFERLRAFLKVEIKGLTELCEIGQVHQDYMESSGRGQEAQLHETRDAILARLTRIGEDAATVRLNAQRMADASKLSVEEAKGFENMQAALVNMAEGLGDALTIFGSEEGHPRVEDAGYTMACERENHLKAVGRAETVTEEQAQVELF